MTESPLVTVAVLTYNGDQYLEQVLSMLEVQEIDGDVEVLVVDSGSTDRTLEIVAGHPTARLHEIPNDEFGHGKTRNLAAKLARGTFVAFLTQDAIPADTRTLAELIAPMVRYPDVVGVTGRQDPRSFCFPLLKYEIKGVFAGLGSSWGTSIDYWDASRGELTLGHPAGFYSDVSSAARRDVLIGQIPYRDVRYAEDQLFGFDILTAGHSKAYAGRSVVIHSNDLTRKEYGQRIFDETVGLRDIGYPVAILPRGYVARTVLKGVLSDSIGIVRDGDYSIARKLYWLVVNPIFHITKWRSYGRAAAVDLDDTAARRLHSLEESRKGS